MREFQVYIKGYPIDGKTTEPNQSLQANDHAVDSDGSWIAGVVVIAELERWADGKLRA